MALIKMQRFHMLAMKEDKDILLKHLQKLGCVEITDAHLESKKTSDFIPNPNVERLKWAVGFLQKYNTAKKPLFESDVFVSTEDMQEVALQETELLSLVAHLENLEKEQGKLLSEHLKLNAEKEELTPWQSLDVPLSSIGSTQDTITQLGYLSTSSWETVKNENLLQGLLVSPQVVSELGGTTYLALVFYKSDFTQGMKALKDAGFNPVQLLGEGTVTQRLQSIEEEKKQLQARESDIKTELSSLVTHIFSLQKLYDYLSIEQQRSAELSKLHLTQSSFYVKGWIPKEATTMVQNLLKSQTNAVEFEFEDPKEGDEPPVLMHNKPVFTPFESIIKGFSYPSPYGIDPTALMMPFFANFFGMMVSDAGYGLVMAVLVPILMKVFNPNVSTKNMLKLITWGGIFTVIWGALYNTWFGFTPWPSVFNPIEKPMPVMALCVGVGAVHLFVGLATAAYMSIKRGDIVSALCDHLSWAVLLIGLGLMMLPTTATVGKVMAIVGAVTIVLTAGREKKNIFSKLISGFGALYGITGWISDLLSYMRLFGMGLATGVIGNVINILVGMCFQGGPIGWVFGAVLFVAAHGFNMGINALGAYVHSCRLQYIEFFGKFYEDGGRPFSPLAEKTRYVQILKTNK